MKISSHADTLGITGKYRGTRLAALLLAAALTSCSCSRQPVQSTPSSSTGSVASNQSEVSSPAESTASTPGKITYPNVPDYNEIFVKEPDQETDAHIASEHETLSRKTGVDVPVAVDGAIEKYGKYFRPNIPAYVLKLAVRPAAHIIATQYEYNVCGITDEALLKANEFLETNGQEPMDIKDPEQNIAAFAIAAMLFYKEDAEGQGYPHITYDLAYAFASALFNSENPAERGAGYIGFLVSRYDRFV